MGESIFLVYYSGARNHESRLLKITEDRVYAHEYADQWTINNGGLRCQIAEIPVVSTVEYPKKEKTDG